MIWRFRGGADFLEPARALDAGRAGVRADHDGLAVIVPDGNNFAAANNAKTVPDENGFAAANLVPNENKVANWRVFFGWALAWEQTAQLHYLP